MKKIYIRRKTAKQILQGLKVGDSLSKISEKLNISINSLRKIVTELKKRGVFKTDSAVELKVSFLFKKLRKKIIEKLKEGRTLPEIRHDLSISKHYFDKIAKKLKRHIDMRPKWKIYYFTKKYGDYIIKKLKEGNTSYAICLELGISRAYIQRILKQLKKKGAIETDKIVKLKGIRLTEERKEKILMVKKLYDEEYTLGKVAAKLNLTRERVRQLLELGNKAKLFIYKPYREIKLEKLINKVPKADIVKELVLSGNCKNIETNYNLKQSDINKLSDYYSIDSGYIKRLRRNKIDLKQYQDIVDFLGHHPTTTELAKKSEWRALWYRISRNWGGFDNFRKEYGIPTPPKGNPKFKDIIIERTKEISEGRKRAIMNLLGSSNKALRYTEVAKILGLCCETARRYLNNLAKENKVEVKIKHPKKFYSLKTNKAILV